MIFRVVPTIRNPVPSTNVNTGFSIDSYLFFKSTIELAVHKVRCFNRGCKPGWLPEFSGVGGLKLAVVLSAPESRKLGPE